MSVKAHAKRARLLLPALLAVLLLTGCLEQISTTRIPAGATRNFLYYLTRDEQDDANAYWAPDHAPADATDQVKQAATTLRDYNLTVTKGDTDQQSDGSVIVTLNGQATRKPTPPPADPTAVPATPLLRARLIMIGPGWRLTDFKLLCCQGQ